MIDKDWVLEQLSLRLSGCKEKYFFSEKNEDLPYNLNIIDNNTKILHSKKINLTFNYDSETYQELSSQKNLISSRTVSFCNYINELGIRGRILFNFNDADGYNYQLNGINQPVIQYCRLKKQRDSVVLFPLSKHSHGFGGANIPNFKDNLSFDEKSDHVVWRGVPTGTYSFLNKKLNAKELYTNEKISHLRGLFPRHNLIPKLYNDEIFNVGFVDYNNAPSKNNKFYKEHIAPYLKERLSIKEQLNNKFILAIDGNDGPSNLYWALMSNSLVLKVQSEWETALCAGLKEWVHYIPVLNELEDIKEKVEYLLKNKETCLKIITNANNYMEKINNKKNRRLLDKLTILSYMSKSLDQPNIRDDYCLFTSNGKKSPNIKDINYKNIKIDHIKSKSDIDYIVDLSIKIEKESLSDSIRLMKIAKELRPHGVVINNWLKKRQAT